MEVKYSEANSTCQSLGGWLFQPRSQFEVNIVLRYASPTFWIGYYETAVVSIFN